MADLGAVKRRMDRMVERRHQWDSLWQEVAELIVPNSATFTTQFAPGQRRRRRILDNSAEQACEVWAEGMQGTMASRQTRWFHLTAPDPRVGKQRDVRTWIADATDAIYGMLNDPMSEFYAALHQAYIEIGAFGTSVIYMPERPDGGMAFRTRFIGECYIDEDRFGRVDTVMTPEQWSISDLIAEFGVENLPAKIREMVTKPNADLNAREHKVVHSVLPRTDRAVGDTARSMPIASIWWMPDYMHTLRESGFREFPFAVPRLARRTGEYYGVGIGIRVLADVRMLQRMWETVIKAAQKAVDPPLMVPDDTFMGPVRTMPGGLSYYRPGSEDFARPLETGSRVDIGMELLREQREVIRKAFFNDVFDITADSTGVNVKATFVNSRRRDKLMRLSPMFSLLEPSLLDPIITRAFRVALRQGMLEDPPEALQESGLEVAYQSAISRAQRGSEVDDIFGLYDVAGPLAESDPGVLDNIDADAVIQHAGTELLNINPRLMRDPRQVQQLRQQRQQQDSAVQTAELAPGVAGAVKDVAQAQAALRE